MRTPLLKSPEHRSRELLNLVAWAGRCAELPHADDAERHWWKSEVRRAQEELRTLQTTDASHGGNYDALPAPHSGQRPALARTWWQQAGQSP